jgi:hypothetical protein
MGGGQSWERTIFADGDQFTRKKFEDVESGVNDQGENQFAANKDSGGDADFVYMPGSTDRDTDAIQYSTGEVIGNQASPDFLRDEKRLFSVEFGKADGILEVTERGFDTPATMIELLEFIRREVIGGKVGNESLIFTGVKFETDDAKRQQKEAIRAIVNEVEGSLLADETNVAIREREVFGLSANDDEANGDIELIIRGEINMMQQSL